MIIHLSLRIELLEEFPLPFPLQIKQENMIQQNYSWREQIEELILSNNSVCFLSSQKLQSLSYQVVEFAQTQKIRVLMTTTEDCKPLKERNQTDGFVSLPLDSSVLKTVLRKVNPLKKTYNCALTLLSFCPNCPDDKINYFLCHPLNWALTDLSFQFDHRIRKGDNLEQVQIQLNVWQVDVVVLDGRCLDDPNYYVQSLSKQFRLAELPLVTLNLKISKAANRVKNLSVFPCLNTCNQQNI